MKKITNILLNIFIVFLIANPIWPFYKKLNYIFITTFLILSILSITYSNKKKIKIDKIDLLLILVPIFYLIPYITKNNLFSITDSIYYILLELSLTLTLLVLRRNINKNNSNTILVTICTTTCIYFFISYLYQIIPKQMMLLSIFNYFGDTYVNSIDRFYGMLDYCNTSALLFLISTFISILKLNEDKNNKNLFRITLLINFCAFLVTFSKMLTIAFTVVLIALIILNKFLKRKEFLMDLKIHLIALIIPSILFVRLHRLFLINLNFLYFIGAILFIIGMYIGVCKLLYFIDNKWQYSSILYLIITMVIITILTINPVSTSLKINNISKNNEYIISDFIIEKNKKYKIKFNVSGNMEDVSFQLCKLYLDEMAPKEKVIKEIDSNKNNIFEFKTDDNFEYYFIKVINLNKNTNIKISNFNINNNEYLINSLLVPYQYIHQLDLIKYDKESVSHRFLYYKNALNIIKENKYIIGSGYNTFAYYALMGEFNYLENDPHSYLFQLWLDIGIYGIVYVLGLIIMGIYYMWQNRKEEDKVIWFCIFSLCMIVLPFDCIYANLYPKVLLILSFIMICDKENFLILDYLYKKIYNKSNKK